MKNNRKVSIYDIAQKLGISASTVSRALSDSSVVKEDRKELIKKTAKLMGYEPNQAAVNLKRGRTNAISILVPIINRYFFSAIIEGAASEIYKAGYDLLICYSMEQYEREVQIINNLSAGKVDGMLACVASQTENFEHFENIIGKGVKTVFFDRKVSIANSPTVTIDDFQAGFDATEHLLEQGCRRIFHFAGPQNHSNWNDRKRGYLAALKKWKVEPEDDWIFVAPTLECEGERFANQIVSMKNRPDAIFFTGDYPAKACYKVFKDNNIRIPQDIAVVGFGNDPFNTMLSPQLSSVDQYNYRIGMIAAKTLLEILNGQPAQSIVITPQLIERESSLKSSL